jgi:hypothetical protein
MSDPDPADIKHSRRCPECDRVTFEFERCHACGDIPWRRSARESSPISEPSGIVGLGAVLYDNRDADHRSCCGKDRKRHLYHVTGVFEETTTGSVRFRVEDGTHTTRECFHADDLLAVFEPAGWSVPTGTKPTYLLTRDHGVDDGHDLMTRNRGESA